MRPSKPLGMPNKYLIILISIKTTSALLCIDGHLNYQKSFFYYVNTSSILQQGCILFLKWSFNNRITIDTPTQKEP